MELINHTLNWTRGEIFEGLIIAISGVATLCCTFLFWKLGTTPNAKAFVIPLLVFALLLAATGASMMISNQLSINKAIARIRWHLFKRKRSA